LEKWKDNRTIKIGKNGISRENILATILSFILLSSSFSLHEVYSDGFNFEVASNLTDADSGFSAFPQIAAVGSNVYVVWQDNTPGMFDIFFSRSTNNGENFDSFIPLSDSDVISENPQIAAVDSNVYVVWQEESADGADIFFSVSINDGENFSEPVSISTIDSGFSGFPQIAAVDSNVYVVWQEFVDGDAEIFFSASIDNGKTFTEPANLSFKDSGIFSANPQIAAVGSNVYVVWQDDGPGEPDIFFTASPNSGADFDSYINLSGSELTSENPQIAAVDSNVYVVWQEFVDDGGEIFFTASSDNGQDFDDPVPISHVEPERVSEFPQIAAVDSNVYVVWQDNDFVSESDIFFTPSNNYGQSFGEPVNLSMTEGFSLFPQLDAFGQNINIVWQDENLGQKDVFFIASQDRGSSFSTRVLVSDNADNSENPEIAVIGTDCHIVWADNSLIPDEDGFLAGDIFYRSCIQVMPEIKFDFSQYKLSDKAMITIIDPSSAGDVSINAEVSTSPSDGNIPSFVLFESDIDPGVFTRQLTFTSGDSTGTAVHAKPGDIITVTLGEISNSALIFPIIIEFDNPSYSLSQSALIKVRDQNSNKVGEEEEISITVTSSTDSFGIPLTLKETGPDTGIFKNKELIFMDGDYRFPINSNIKISLEENAGDLDTNNFIDTISVKITSRDPFDPILVKEIQFFTLTETDGSTGLFEGIFTITSGPTSSNAIQAKEGDIVSVTYLGETANGLVIPNPNGNVGAIQAANGDNIITRYSGESDEVFISPGSAPGGAAGGAIRPGLVPHTILGIFGGSSGGSNSPPSFGSSSFASITGGEEGFGGILNDNDVNTLEETKTFKVGEKAILRFDFTEGGGIGKIEHIGLYTNVRDGQKRQDSDAYIYYDPLKSPTITVHDPNGFFSEANFDLLQMDVTKFVLKFDLTFAKPMAKSDLILESWNLKKWSSINKIPNAIEVISSGIISEEESEPVKTFLEDVTDDQVIPVWIKSNAKWWSDDEIDNENFISGIEYLVNEGIIKVSLTETTDNSISEIPPWIKNNAGWWAEEMISDDEFLQGIEWLVKNKIIIV